MIRRSPRARSPLNVSFAVHSYNEADALRRLVLSSLPFAGSFQEWVILDHRSDDDTAEVIDELAPLLASKGIALQRLHEERDFSVSYTFADVRNATINACSHPVVALLDADFILGPGFGDFLRRSLTALRHRTYYGAAYSVPCVWDHLRTDSAGRIASHGRVWVHQIRDRIFWRDAVHYEQTGQGGRWERIKLDDPSRRNRLSLTRNRNGPLTRDAVVSVNVKPPERIELRDTMTTFLQDAMQGKASGTWLENHAAGVTRKQPAYPYQSCSLLGWRLHAPSLNLAA